MTKHLKLKVKNTQLAAALQLSRKKKEDANLAKKRPKVAKKATAKKLPTPLESDASKSTAQKEKIPTEATVEQTPSSPLPPREAQSQSAPAEKKNVEENPQVAAAPKESPSTEKKGAKAKDATEAAAQRSNFSPDKGENGFRAQLSRKKGKEFKAKQQLKKTFDARDRQGLRVGEEQQWRRRKPRPKYQQRKTIEIIRPKHLSVRVPISIKDLAQSMKLKASALLSKLFIQGIKLTINDLLDDETTIQLLGQEFDCDIAIDTSAEKRLRITDEAITEEIAKTPAEQLSPRPPIIAFMGHVDHGKTSLIDVIRKSNIAGGEAGAITQHIGAFRCHRKQGDITILDTPGHEAFTVMRQRGAAVTDLVVLVIAGDEGIMPQTDEAIAQARAAQVPLLVAINKSDKQGFDSDQIYRQLADRELLPESWGGEIVTVNCSAITGEGIPELLEMLTLQSEILELRANPSARARGTVIESALHKGFGAVATLLIQNGTLHLGDALVFDEIYARVKTMHDEHGKAITSAAPSIPVKITGLSGVPDAGCEFIVVKNEKEARKLCEDRTSGAKRLQRKRPQIEGLDTLLKERQEKHEKKTLYLILRADVQGSIEAIKTSLQNIKTDKVLLNFISAEVGEVSESDVELALASQAAIIGFHVHVESHASQLIKQNKLPFTMRTIIYELVDDVKKMMLQKLDKVREENHVGTAEVQQIFKASQIGAIAGCHVVDGTIKRNHEVKIVRGDKVVWTGKIASLKRVKDDVKEVAKGLECGIVFEQFNDIQVQDKVQTFEITYKSQEL